jgi:hypothetical protein
MDLSLRDPGFNSDVPDSVAGLATRFELLTTAEKDLAADKFFMFPLEILIRNALFSRKPFIVGVPRRNLQPLSVLQVRIFIWLGGCGRP